MFLGICLGFLKNNLRKFLLGGICRASGVPSPAIWFVGRGLDPSVRCYCCCKAARTAYMPHLRTCGEFAGDAYMPSPAAWRLPPSFAEGSRPLPTEPGESTGKTKSSPPCRRGAQGCLPYTRVFKTSCSGTGASMGRGVPSTHWMAFFGHLETQVPQPLHLV